MARKDYYNCELAPEVNSIVAAASAVLTNKNGDILLHKRRDNYQWSLIGGGMEYGESISQTILREIEEETGYKANIDKVIGIYSNPRHVIAYSDGEVRQQFSICFHCVIDGGNKKISNESIELRFFNRNEIETLEIHESQRTRIEDYYENRERAFIR
ncbi:NUDIX domain-containing protein [Vallitaleaceae bacterium 9-2]